MRSWTDYKNTAQLENSIFNSARNGNVIQLQTFQRMGLHLNQKDEKGYSPLMLAAYNGHFLAAKWLIQNGADVNNVDHSTNSILMGVAFKGHLEIFELLVESNADFTYVNNKGQTAMDFALMFGRTAIVERLNQLSPKKIPTGLPQKIKSWITYLTN